MYFVGSYRKQKSQVSMRTRAKQFIKHAWEWAVALFITIIEMHNKGSKYYYVSFCILTLHLSSREKDWMNNNYYGNSTLMHSTHKKYLDMCKHRVTPSFAVTCPRDHRSRNYRGSANKDVYTLKSKEWIYTVIQI